MEDTENRVKCDSLWRPLKRDKPNGVEDLHYAKTHIFLVRLFYYFFLIFSLHFTCYPLTFKDLHNMDQVN